MTNIARTYHVSRIFRPTALARFSSILLSICIILVLGVLPAAAGPVPGTDEQNPNVNPLVRCEPTAVSANVGDTVTIDLYIQDVSNLYGLDFRVSYNPTIGQVVDQNMYIPGTQIQPLYSWTVPGFIIKQDTYLPSDIPPNCGVHCIWLAFTQLNPTPPANGSGPVARVTFLGLQPGTFPMNWINTALSAPGGIPITPVDRQACQVTFIDPMAVTLAGFDATAQPDHVLLAWETASELDNLGFNLYRGLSPDEPDLQLNDALIPSMAPGSPSGFAYTWQDRQDLASGTTYYYWLDAIDTANTATRFGPVSATYFAPTATGLGMMEADNTRPAIPPVAVWLTILAGSLTLWLYWRRSQKLKS